MTDLAFWSKVATLAKACEASRYPNAAGMPVCMHHHGELAPGATFCANAAPHRDAKLAAAPPPVQLSLLGAEDGGGS